MSYFYTSTSNGHHSAEHGIKAAPGGGGSKYIYSGQISVFFLVFGCSLLGVATADHLLATLHVNLSGFYINIALLWLLSSKVLMTTT